MFNHGRAEVVFKDVLQVFKGELSPVFVSL
jgi:hypothetical protein